MTARDASDIDLDDADAGVDVVGGVAINDMTAVSRKRVAALLAAPAVAAALAARDVTAIYCYLHGQRVSQRTIARLTGQSESEVSDILAGRRVVAVDVLERIADGLGVSHGRMGLAHAVLSGPFRRRVRMYGRPPVWTLWGGHRPQTSPAQQSRHSLGPADVVAAGGAQAALVRPGRSVQSDPLLTSAEVAQWNGLLVRSLRICRRMTVREFAGHLGVSERMVNKWEAGGAGVTPRPVNQAAMDTSYEMSTPLVKERFAIELRRIRARGTTRPSATTQDEIQPPVTADPLNEAAAAPGLVGVVVTGDVASSIQSGGMS